MAHGISGVLIPTIHVLVLGLSPPSSERRAMSTALEQAPPNTSAVVADDYSITTELNSQLHLPSLWQLHPPPASHLFHGLPPGAGFSASRLASGGWHHPEHAHESQSLLNSQSVPRMYMHIQLKYAINRLQADSKCMLAQKRNNMSSAVKNCPHSFLKLCLVLL